MTTDIKSNQVKEYLDRVQQIAQAVSAEEFSALVDAIVDAYHRERTVFIIGNGGSGANASHLCEDLGKGTLSDFEEQKRLKVISLTDNTAYILAWGNDTSYDRIFTEQLKNLAAPGDLLIAISGSGNSPNILNAVAWANAHGLRTVGVTGYAGGTLRDLAGQGLHVPSMDMGIVEAVHGIFFHLLIDLLRERFLEEE